MEAKNIKKTANMQGWQPNTELCIDLKTILRSDRRANLKKDYMGVLTRDGEHHYSFIESVFKSSACHRNVHLFVGKHITLTCSPDGMLRLNFKNLVVDEDFSVERYAFGVYNELCMALGGLIEER